MGEFTIDVLGFEFCAYSPEPTMLCLETEAGDVLFFRHTARGSRTIPPEQHWSCRFVVRGNEYADFAGTGPTREDAMRAMVRTPKFCAFADAVAKLASTAQAAE